MENGFAPSFGMVASFYSALVGNARAERWQPEAVQYVQRLSIGSLIRHAYEHVPFYREHFSRAGVRPKEIRRADDLWRIPSITKKELLAAGFTATDERIPRERLIVGATSGSSGQRLTLFGTRDETSRLGGYLWSPLVAAGLKPTHRIVTVGSKHFQFAPPPYRCTWLSREGTVEEWIRTLRRIEPHAIIGQMERIALIAHELLRSGRVLRRRVQRIWTFGWTLTEEVRAVIRDAFGVDPIDAYGTTETIWVAMQCGKRLGLHIPSHRLVVQCSVPGNPAKPAAPGQVGDLILTDLARRTMPIIRYRIGDAGAVVHRSCLCGRAGPEIVNLLGRVMDLFVSEDGRPVGSGELRVFRALRLGWLSDCQVIQETPRRLRLLWVPGPKWSSEAMDRIRSEIKRALGPIEILDERFDTLPADASSKPRRFRRDFDVADDVLLRYRPPEMRRST